MSVLRQAKSHPSGRNISRGARITDEDAIAEMDDILRQRVVSLRLEWERAQAALDRVRAQMAPSQSIPLELVECFGRAMRDTIRCEDVPFLEA